MGEGELVLGIDAGAGGGVFRLRVKMSLVRTRILRITLFYLILIGFHLIWHIQNRINLKQSINQSIIQFYIRSLFILQISLLYQFFITLYLIADLKGLESFKTQTAFVSLADFGDDFLLVFERGECAYLFDKRLVMNSLVNEDGKFNIVGGGGANL